jgi:hypothetical protein
MNHEELSRRMGPYNPNQSHRSRMTKMGIILAKERKANVQKELDENIAKSIKKSAKEKALNKHK